MAMFTKQELEEAQFSLASTLRKCEKIQEGGKLQSSQKTLNTVLILKKQKACLTMNMQFIYLIPNTLITRIDL